MVERRRQWLNLAGCPAVNLRFMVTTLTQKCSLTFDEWLELVCTVLLKYSSAMETARLPFEVHPLLKNGHAMTIVSAFLPRRFDTPPAEPRLFQVSPGSTLPPHCSCQPGTPKTRPSIVTVNRLRGSS